MEKRPMHDGKIDNSMNYGSLESVQAKNYRTNAENHRVDERRHNCIDVDRSEQRANDNGTRDFSEVVRGSIQKEMSHDLFLKKWSDDAAGYDAEHIEFEWNFIQWYGVAGMSWGKLCKSNPKCSTNEAGANQHR